MEELNNRLCNIKDSYSDFVGAIMHYANEKPSRLEVLIDFLNNNPNASSSDVVKFVSDQPDFSDDAAYMQVG